MGMPIHPASSSVDSSQLPENAELRRLIALRRELDQPDLTLEEAAAAELFRREVQAKVLVREMARAATRDARSHRALVGG